MSHPRREERRRQVGHLAWPSSLLSRSRGCHFGVVSAKSMQPWYKARMQQRELSIRPLRFLRALDASPILATCIRARSAIVARYSPPSLSLSPSDCLSILYNSRHKLFADSEFSVHGNGEPMSAGSPPASLYLGPLEVFQLRTRFSVRDFSICERDKYNGVSDIPSRYIAQYPFAFCG